MQQSRRKTPLRNLTTYARSHAVRHPDCDYIGDADIHVTICAATGAPFGDNPVAQMVCDNVPRSCELLRYQLYGFCLMPDHLHVLVSPANSDLALGRWLDRFKSYTTHMYMKLGGHPPLWQRSAHDHICRAEETAEKALVYIINNPVRAGLVDRWQDWPWTRVFVDL